MEEVRVAPEYRIYIVIIVDWHPKIEEELIRLNLVKPANQENK